MHNSRKGQGSGGFSEVGYTKLSLELVIQYLSLRLFS